MKTRSTIDDPTHWRQRAEQARRVADQLDDPIAKKTMEEDHAGYRSFVRAIGRARSSEARAQNFHLMVVGRWALIVRIFNRVAVALRARGRRAQPNAHQSGTVRILPTFQEL
jgi:hypothetical protein